MNGQEIRESDVGTLVESLMADDTAGYSHRIPAGMEIKVARVEPKFIGFHTGDVIEGENYFITPLTLEFRRKFRKSGTRKFRVWFTTPIGFERFVDVEAIGEEGAKRLAEKQVPAGSEFRGVFRKQGAASQIPGQARVYPEVRGGKLYAKTPRGRRELQSLRRKKPRGLVSELIK